MGLLERIKNKLKASIKGKKASLVKRKAVPELKSREEARPMGATVAVEESKFYTGPEIPAVRLQPFIWELPAGYGHDKIVLQVRDPWWLHSYWEFTTSTLDKIKAELGASSQGAKTILRVYDVSFIEFNGTNAHSYFDIEVQDANNWYIDTQGPGRSWCVDLGLRLSDGRFIKIVRSNSVTTPLDGPSWQTDEEWMIPEDLFARLYGLGIGTGSSPVGIRKVWQERLKRELGSGAFVSGGFSPVKKKQKRGFWFVLNTELIVYGATEADAKVTMQGKPVNLRPDGTFSLRFALPDGKQVIPVKAVSAHGLEERTITPIVTRETK